MINPSLYQEFVENLLANDSKDIEAYKARIDAVHTETGFNLVRLDTAASGMSAEAGEFMEVIKKVKYQGKTLDDHNVFHLKRELGDIMFYAFVALEALNTDLDEIIEMNVDKLKARYPGGEFTVSRSEVREDGDI